MDEAFCACMRIAIAAGLENAPVGVITTPGTKNPKYVSAEHWVAKLFVGQCGLLVGDNINDAVMSLRLVLQLERVLRNIGREKTPKRDGNHGSPCGVQAVSHKGRSLAFVA
jgi:hypothetical protein